NQDVEKEEPLKLVSPNNPDPPEIIFLSNIDLAVAFPVETVFFFEVTPDKSSSTLNISHRLEKAVAEVLLVPYYFMAGRLNFNHQTRRLELLCNNAGALFVTRFSCGGFSVGFVTNHGILDGKSASEMFQNLASICRGENILNQVLYNDRTCFRARIPPQIKYPHMEYVKLQDISSLASSFTAPNQLFPLDIRSKTSPPLPNGFVGNAVITAFATSKVAELVEKPFCFCVEKMREAIERVTEEYVRSVIDWLEVYKGVPATCNGNFYVSAWSKLPFGELDFGFGKLAHGGP
ncbi:hypothetical protein I3843_01G141200, partial [Carya illinoinensis]